MCIGSLLPGGNMKSESRYLQNDKWIDGHTIIYSENSNAKVAFG